MVGQPLLSSQRPSEGTEEASYDSCGPIWKSKEDRGRAETDEEVPEGTGNMAFWKHSRETSCLSLQELSAIEVIKRRMNKALTPPPPPKCNIYTKTILWVDHRWNQSSLVTDKLCFHYSSLSLFQETGPWKGRGNEDIKGRPSYSPKSK